MKKFKIYETFKTDNGGVFRQIEEIEAENIGSAVQFAVDKYPKATLRISGDDVAVETQPNRTPEELQELMDYLSAYDDTK